MLIPLRSLFEAPVVIVPPPVGGGGGGSVGVGHGLHPFQPFTPPRVSVTVTLRPARATFRAGKIEAFGGANVTFLPVKGSFSVGKLEPTAGATVQMAAATSKFQLGKVSASGVDNDPLIAMALLDL